MESAQYSAFYRIVLSKFSNYQYICNSISINKTRRQSFITDWNLCEMREELVEIQRYQDSPRPKAQGSILLWRTSWNIRYMLPPQAQYTSFNVTQYQTQSQPREGGFHLSMTNRIYFYQIYYSRQHSWTFVGYRQCWSSHCAFSLFGSIVAYSAISSVRNVNAKNNFYRSFSP